MERPRDALPKGTKLGGYIIGRVLGRGGFGVTYFGHDALFPEAKVAIKEFLPSGLAVREPGSLSVHSSGSGYEADFQKALTRFEEEARTLVALRHPNVVEVQRYIEANGTAYVVMRYEEGQSLSELLAGGKTLSAAELSDIVAPLLDGLEAVHSRNYLHRDIKPGNIYIRAADGSPVLLDFGAARQAMGIERKTSLTEIVTPGYAPFEQYFRKGEQGPWTDLYSLGATFYRCIAGEAPPEAPERLRRDEMLPARDVGKGRYPPPLLNAIDAMLHVDERKRPPSVVRLRELMEIEPRAGRLENAADTRGMRQADTLIAGQGVDFTRAPNFSDQVLVAKRGDMDAQVEVGLCYEKGVGVRQDLTEALAWYRRAAEGGHAKGQVRIGAMYWVGRGVREDAVEAVKWFREAANQSDPDGQRRLGDAYAMGKGVPWDYGEAAKWYRKAAEQGDTSARLNLDYIFGATRGIFGDPIKSR